MFIKEPVVGNDDEAFSTAGYDLLLRQAAAAGQTKSEAVGEETLLMHPERRTEAPPHVPPQHDACSPATFDQREIGVHLICSINGHVQLRVSVQVGQREAVLQNQLASLATST